MTDERGDIAGVELFLRLSSLTPFELDGCLCVGDQVNAAVNRWAFGPDLTGFEAFINHVHVDQLLKHQPDAMRVWGRNALLRLVVTCLGAATLPILRDRTLLFFGGGPNIEDCTVRFHVERDGAPWVDIEDKAFLSRESLCVWRFSASGIETIFEAEASRSDTSESGSSGGRSL